VNMLTVVIIGAGFSGISLAVNLLRRADKRLHVLLIDSHPKRKGGVAYGSAKDEHILNVPAGGMSVFSDQTDDFLRYASRKLENVSAESFISRRTYSEYLQEKLREAACSGSLSEISGTAIDVSVTSPSGFEVELEDGRSLRGDRLVLALGHFRPASPCEISEEVYNHGGYWGNPWEEMCFDSIDPCEPVLLLGSALTAIDSALTLLKANPMRKIDMVSRRGVLPQVHQLKDVSKFSAIPLDVTGGTVLRTLIRSVRQHISCDGQVPGSWQRTINAMRPFTKTLWQELSISDRRRFLRHVRFYWDSHRHRLAPSSHRIICEAIERGVLRVHKGRIRQLSVIDSYLMLRYGKDDQDSAREIVASAVINCTGPSTSLKHAESLVVRNLLRRGLIRSDELELGLDVTETLQPLDKNGSTTDGMYYIGPLLKGKYWEATAVPELRSFAETLACDLVSCL
jgi:uncharacterized NAD(P)/FAD-binding protein YdhS